MPNQMIALQSRNPQLPDPARQTAQFANFMNMAKQQEAAQRQAQQAQQAMDIEAAKEARAAAMHGPALTKAQQDNIVQALGIFREAVGDIAEGDIAAAEAVRADLVSRVPGYDKFIPPASQWTGDTIRKLMLTSEKEIEKTIATPVASLEISTSGAPRSVTVGGLRPGQQGVYDIPETPTAAPRATPTAPQTNPMAAGATPRAADAEPGSLGLVIASALETGVMSKTDYDKMLSIAQPQSRAKIAAWAQQNNIEIIPDTPGVTDNQMRGAAADFETTPMAYDGQTPQSQFAVYRGQPMQAQTAGLSGAPEMRQTLAQARTSTPLQMRNPNVSPLPGSAQVPLPRVAAEARAGRPSAQELYDAEAAKIKAARDAGPAPVTAQQKIARKTEVAQAYSRAQTLIDKAYNPKEGIISIANKIKSLSPDQKEAITGYSNYIPSFRGATREADTLFGNLKGVVTSLGKDAAAASGAVGNMAVQEWKIAADMIANLDLANMTPRALDAQMDRIIEQVSNATKLAERVYDIQYGDDVKQYPAFKLRGTPPARAKTPVVKGGSRLSPDIENILKSRGI
jgi:hypothetical protein